MPSKKLQLQVQFTKEGETFIAYSPALDLSSCGGTFEEAQRNFEEAADIFFEECDADGTIIDVLKSLGWEQVEKPTPQWLPPRIVGNVNIPVSVPA